MEDTITAMNRINPSLETPKTYPRHILAENILSQHFFEYL
jgi:hypothetical protein